MSAMLDEMREEARKEGMMSLINKMLDDDRFTIQMISEISGLSVEEVENLRVQVAN